MLSKMGIKELSWSFDTPAIFNLCFGWEWDLTHIAQKNYSCRQNKRETCGDLQTCSSSSGVLFHYQLKNNFSVRN